MVTRGGTACGAQLDVFTTPRLRAERLTTAHLPDLRRMDMNPDVMTYLGGLRDEAGTLAYLKRNLSHWSTHGFGLWMLRSVGSGEVVGRACVRHVAVEARDDIEIGYLFLPAYWGQGFATEIAKACVDLAFTQLGCPSVVGLTLPANLGSQRVLRKAGLVYDRDVQFEGLPHLLFRTVRPPGVLSVPAVRT
jgi:RimJ/RimL family protein N-acetyltransferase